MVGMGEEDWEEDWMTRLFSALTMDSRDGCSGTSPTLTTTKRFSLFESSGRGSLAVLVLFDVRLLYVPNISVGLTYICFGGRQGDCQQG